MYVFKCGCRYPPEKVPGNVKKCPVHHTRLKSIEKNCLKCGAVFITGSGPSAITFCINCVKKPNSNRIYIFNECGCKIPKNSMRVKTGAILCPEHGSTLNLVQRPCAKCGADFADIPKNSRRMYCDTCRTFVEKYPNNRRYVFKCGCERPACIYKNKKKVCPEHGERIKEIRANCTGCNQELSTTILGENILNCEPCKYLRAQARQREYRRTPAKKEARKHSLSLLYAMTLEDIGTEFKRTRERIRQIEEQGLKRFKRKFEVKFPEEVADLKTKIGDVWPLYLMLNLRERERQEYESQREWLEFGEMAGV